MSPDIITVQNTLLRRSWHRRRSGHAVSDAIKSITTRFTGQSAMVVSVHRSGSTIWHDNTFLGRDPSAATTIPHLLTYRQLGLVSNDLSNWGFGGWRERMG